MSFILSLIPTVIIFSIIVIVHEFGHFIAARKCGVMVEEFAIGMGPKILSKQFGETLFSIRAFPIGGFCRMLGEDEDSPGEPRAFNNKSLPRRAIVISAGIILNTVLAFAAFLIPTLLVGYVTTEIGSLTAGLNAESAGLRVGDKIESINGTAILDHSDVILAQMDYDGAPVVIGVRRSGERLNIPVVPVYDEDTGLFYLGFSVSQKTGLLQTPVEGYERTGFFESLDVSARQTISNVRGVYVGLFKLISGNVGTDQMMGMIGIGSIIGENVEATLKFGVFETVISMLKLIGILSINLAVINLLPLPALDGGRLVFFAVEAVRRKPIDPGKEGMVHFVGLVVLMIFAVVVAAKDILRLF